MRRLQRFGCIYLIIVVLLLGGYSAQAQTQEVSSDAPQFLYRNGDKLILVNAETGEAEILPGISVGENDKLVWSPNGHYLAVEISPNGEAYPRQYCLNFYNVDVQKMLYEKPLNCNVETFGFSNDDTQLAYATRLENAFNSVLWLYKFSNKGISRIYETSYGEPPLQEAGISDIRWSPTNSYIIFTSYVTIMGGSLNSLNILNTKTLSSYPLSGGSWGYYARYRPLWSPDDQWFLLDLLDNYVISGAIPFTHDQGDLYLIQSETGEIQRLTYTPAEYEANARWTDEGRIAYDVSRTITLTVHEALQIQAPPPDTIVPPEPVHEEEMPQRCHDIELSPDGNFSVRICPPDSGAGETTDTFRIQQGDENLYYAPLPTENSDAKTILIGWRPQTK